MNTADSPSADAVLAADSFLVDDGLLLGGAVHRDRFVADSSAAAEYAGRAGFADEATAFWDAAVARVPAEGRYFPRIQVGRPDPGGLPSFDVRVRPAPPASSTVRLVSASGDPRTTPRRKGPDLARLDLLRQQAMRTGADEAVILSPDGLVIEGNYSSIVWWRGDALCVVDATLARLPGVTERTLVTLATALGIDVLHELVEPSDLDGLEVWSLGSLHGPRIATSWAGITLAETPGRLRQWRARLDALRRPA